MLRRVLAGIWLVMLIVDWQGARAASLAPAPRTALDLPVAPVPSAPESEWPRHAWAVGPSTGVWLPHCGWAAPACGAEPQLDLSLNLLSRPGAYFSWGLLARLGSSSFAADSSQSSELLALAGRVFFTDRGRWDPYLMLAVGPGRFRSRGFLESGSADGWEASRDGIFAVAGAGLGLALLPRLRLSPSLELTRHLTGGRARCTGQCASFPAWNHEPTWLRLGLELSLELGEAL